MLEKYLTVRNVLRRFIDVSNIVTGKSIIVEVWNWDNTHLLASPLLQFKFKNKNQMYDCLKENNMLDYWVGSIEIHDSYNKWVITQKCD